MSLTTEQSTIFRATWDSNRRTSGRLDPPPMWIQRTFQANEAWTDPTPHGRMFQRKRHGRTGGSTTKIHVDSYVHCQPTLRSFTFTACFRATRKTALRKPGGWHGLGGGLLEEQQLVSSSKCVPQHVYLRKLPPSFLWSAARPVPCTYILLASSTAALTTCYTCECCGKGETFFVVKSCYLCVVKQCLLWRNLNL